MVAECQSNGPCAIVESRLTVLAAFEMTFLLITLKLRDSGFVTLSQPLPSRDLPGFLAGTHPAGSRLPSTV